MNKEENSVFGANTKKKIAKAMNSFEARMVKSSNDLERLSILDDLDNILDAEIDAWLIEMENNQSEESEKSDAIFNEGTKHVAELQESKLKINELRTSFLPGALKLYQVKKNQHERVVVPKSLQVELNNNKS